VRRFQGRIYGLAFHYMRNAEEARDMAQEIFIQIYRKLDSFNDEENLLPWMLRLARNRCIDRLRRLKTRPPAEDVLVEEAQEITDSRPGPEEEYVAGGRRQLLYRALDEMSEMNREMILLKDIQGLELSEISRMLRLPLGTVKSRSHRARLELATKVRALDPSYGV